ALVAPPSDEDESPDAAEAEADIAQAEAEAAEADADAEADEADAKAEPAEVAEAVEDARPADHDTGSDEADELDKELLLKAARSISLYHLDRAWAEHLAKLAEVREGVHLRALGRLDPLDEFHRAAVPAFNQLRAEITRRARESFTEADITADWEPADVGPLRPSATWTYLVHDNPFGSELERLVSSVS